MSDEIHSYIQLQQQIPRLLARPASRLGRAEWQLPHLPTRMSHASTELLGLSHLTNSAIPSVAASEARREIAWENDGRLA